MLLPLAALGCVIQGVGMVESDRDLQRLALVFFGLFLVALGYLVAQSGFLPRAIGFWLLLGGIGWCTSVVIPNLPFAVAVGVQGFSGLSELAFALWLRFGGEATPRPSRGDSLREAKGLAQVAAASRRPPMEDPSEIDDYSNWIGGFYELSIKVGPRRDDTRLERLLVAIWRLANATGPFIRHDDGPSRVAPLDLVSLSQHIYGVVRLPNRSHVVCGATAIRLDRGPDLLSFYMPLAALARIDPRIQGFPFGEGSGAASLAWRRPDR